MKILICAIFLLPFMLHSQDDAEIQKKLKTYKTMYEDSLINLEEYNKAKQSTLFPIVSNKTEESIEKKQKSLSDLKDSYLPQLVGGSLMFAAGIGTIAGGIVFSKNKLPNISDYTKSHVVNINSYNSALKNYKTNRIIIYSIGSVCAGVGLVLDILGAHNKVLYENAKKGLALKLSENNYGLAFNF